MPSGPSSCCFSTDLLNGTDHRSIHEGTAEGGMGMIHQLLQIGALSSLKPYT